MMAKPMKTLELHYPMIQFLIIPNIQGGAITTFSERKRSELGGEWRELWE